MKDYSFRFEDDEDKLGEAVRNIIRNSQTNPLNNEDWQKPPEDLMYDPCLFQKDREVEINQLCNSSEIFATLYKTNPLVRKAASYYIREGVWAIDRMFIEIIQIQALEINRLRDYRRTNGQSD